MRTPVCVISSYAHGFQSAGTSSDLTDTTCKLTVWHHGTVVNICSVFFTANLAAVIRLLSVFEVDPTRADRQEVVLSYGRPSGTNRAESRQSQPPTAARSGDDRCPDISRMTKIKCNMGRASAVKRLRSPVVLVAAVGSGSLTDQARTHKRRSSQGQKCHIAHGDVFLEVCVCKCIATCSSSNKRCTDIHMSHTRLTNSSLH